MNSPAPFGAVVLRDPVLYDLNNEIEELQRQKIEQFDSLNTPTSILLVNPQTKMVRSVGEITKDCWSPLLGDEVESYIHLTGQSVSMYEFIGLEIWVGQKKIGTMLNALRVADCEDHSENDEAMKQTHVLVEDDDSCLSVIFEYPKDDQYDRFSHPLDIGTIILNTVTISAAILYANISAPNEVVFSRRKEIFFQKEN